MLQFPANVAPNHCAIQAGHRSVRADQALQHTRPSGNTSLLPPQTGNRAQSNAEDLSSHPPSEAVFSTVLVSSVQLSGIIATLSIRCGCYPQKASNYPLRRQVTLKFNILCTQKTVTFNLNICPSLLWGFCFGPLFSLLVARIGRVDRCEVIVGPDVYDHIG